jgi:membrane-associated phospholipid phosphatase
LPPPHFQRRPFLLLNVAAALLFASWVLPATRLRWEALDTQVFTVLNGTLDASGPGPWNGLWALVNARYFDALSFVVMGVLLTVCCMAHGKQRILYGLAVFPVLLFLLILARESLEAVADVSGWNHNSPSMQHESTVWLSRIYPGWGTKDKSLASFPGDHAGVLFIWLGYCLYLVRNRWSLLVAILTGLGMLPRLVSGAHTVSDELVGGGVAALVALSVCLYTPLCAPAIRGISVGAKRVLRKLSGRPLPPAWVAALTLDHTSEPDDTRQAEA